MPKKRLTGVITKISSQSNVQVTLSTIEKHGVYQKGISMKKTHRALNSLGAKLNQKVVIEECPPVSKTIHFRVISVIEE